MDTIVKVRSLKLERAGVRILDGIDLDVAPAETLGISGPNGSGKTTLLRAIATLTPPSSGSVTIFDGTEPRQARRRIGMIGHHPYLVPELTLSENLHHIARLAGFDPDRVDHAIDVVGLTGARDRRAAVASFGMLRRIEIAQQLVAKPDIMLLDEAVSGLDESARELISEVIRLTTGRGGSVVMVSHDRSHLEKSCDRVVTLVGGRIEDAS